ncbi:transcriptional regulator [Vibrio ordalii FF-167]|nr:transcriptional regulator [Vibrio ordalii FF-167]
MANLDIRSETLLPFASGWLQPDAEEIRKLLKFAELSGSEVGKLVGVSSRTVRKWVGGQSPIPYAAWALLIEITMDHKIWFSN